MSLPAGAPPPAPSNIEGSVGWIHAMDGDDTAMCSSADLEQIDRRLWSDVPVARRCRVCDVLAR
jgi:hypothetical protein